jgi:broad specificity phosphatase PhoE
MGCLFELTLISILLQLREGMSYAEIQRQYPQEFAARQANKLYYRYPGMGGESYTGKPWSVVADFYPYKK